MNKKIKIGTNPKTRKYKKKQKKQLLEDGNLIDECPSMQCIREIFRVFFCIIFHDSKNPAQKFVKQGFQTAITLSKQKQVDNQTQDNQRQEQFRPFSDA